MILATTTGDFGAYTNKQEESMRYIHQAGFRYLDYNFGMDYRQGNGAYQNDWKEYMLDLRQKADQLGMKFVQAHSPMGSPIVRGDGYIPFIEATKRCIESCALLGIDRITVHSGYEYGLSKEEAFERNKEFYMALLPLAEQVGVHVLVENFNKMYKEGVYWIDNAPDLRALIDYVDHPYFHACWDAGHGNMQEMPQDEALRILGKHVYALHVQDNTGDHDMHIAPMFGTLNLDSLMHGLMDIGYQGAFTFEATTFFLSGKYHRPFEKDQRLQKVSLGVKMKAESLLYEIGKFTLQSYDCFEE